MVLVLLSIVSAGFYSNCLVFLYISSYSLFVVISEAEMKIYFQREYLYLNLPKAWGYLSIWEYIQINLGLKVLWACIGNMSFRFINFHEGRLVVKFSGKIFLLLPRIK